MTIYDKFHIYFLTPDNEKIYCPAIVGQSILEIAKNNNIKVKGNCGGVVACSTCLVNVEEIFFEKYEELTEISNEELDIIEKNIFNKYNSRLCCQILFSENLNGISFFITQSSYGESH